MIEYLKKAGLAKLSAIVLGMLMMLDYCLTWIGVNELGVIEEANPLMVWLFNIGFAPSLLLRVIMVSFVLYLIYVLSKFSDRLFKFTITLALTVNFAVILLHVRWLYLTYI